jgi:hypothetical protein
MVNEQQTMNDDTPCLAITFQLKQSPVHRSRQGFEVNNKLLLLDKEHLLQVGEDILSTN